MGKFTRIEDEFATTFLWERELTYSKRQSWLAKYRNAHIRNPTSAEVAFRHILLELGIYYKSQKGFMMPPRFIIVDFYLPRLKICIEIDGPGHQATRQARRDKRRDTYLHNRGFRVWRFNNDEVLNNKESIKDELKREVIGSPLVESPKHIGTTPHDVYVEPSPTM